MPLAVADEILLFGEHAATKPTPKRHMPPCAYHLVRILARPPQLQLQQEPLLDRLAGINPTRGERGTDGRGCGRGSVALGVREGPQRPLRQHHFLDLLAVLVDNSHDVGHLWDVRVGMVEHDDGLVSLRPLYELDAAEGEEPEGLLHVTRRRLPATSLRGRTCTLL